MSFLELLFGFHGRINAAQFRQGGTLAGVIAGLLLAMSGGLIFNGGLVIELRANAVALLAIWGGVLVFILWSNAALQAKRLHDRGRSGFLCLISIFVFLSWAAIVCYMGTASIRAEGDNEAMSYLPTLLQESSQILFALSGASFLVGLWVFIDLGLLPGASGPNQFGPEPGAPDQPFNGSSSQGPASARKSWFAAKQSTHSSASAWDVSGAEAALAKAIAERNSNGAAASGETWKETAQAQFSKASGAPVFGRRN